MPIFTTEFLYGRNEFIVGFVYFVLLVGASEAGSWLAERMYAHANEERSAKIAELSTVQTVVFAVLGLLLAFTFSMVVSRYDARKQALVDETNAIGTTYLRSQLLPEPERAETVILLREYVDARVDSARPDWYQDTSLLQRTSSLQQQLWSRAVAAGKQDPDAITIGLYIQSLNDTIDAQGTRDAARLNSLPVIVLYLLFAVSVLGMAVHGYTSGLEHGRSIPATILLALLLTLIAIVIIDMDQPYGGLISISQQSLIQLRQSMGNGPVAP
ncbi:MAG: hypothetical protein ACLQUY_01700 [Ktedonobacterales bacterium]